MPTSSRFAGTAIDVACGLGANALFLARRGLQTLAWDLSEVAVAKLQDFARTQGIPLSAEARDVLAHPPPPASADVIVVSRFLDRPLAPRLEQALRPGGILFYQTFTREKVGSAGPISPEFLLGRNELLHLFPNLRVVAYREEGLIGDLTQGLRNEALLVAQQPA